MIGRFLRLLPIYIIFIYVSIGLFSCVTLKQIKLFQDIPDSTKLSNLKLPTFVPPVIQPGDVLSISIITTDVGAPVNVNAGNAQAISASAGGGSAGETGYLVDKEGNIEIPELGKINVLGLTIDQAKETVKKKALFYFKDPTIIIKSKNLKITLLGEIQRPGSYNITNEKFTIIDALSYAGDFTSYGRRDNVLLLRQNDNHTLSSIRIDMRNSAILKSPYYYLQNNDVLYIEPTVGKARASDAIFDRNISYITVALGLLTTLLVLVKK